MAKPASKKPLQPRLIREVMGTEQLTGYEGALGQTFSLGTQTVFNIALKKAEYSAGRVNLGESAYLPLGNEKFLVLHFTIQNPRKEAFLFTPGFLDIKAVDSSGVTRPALTDIGREITHESVSYSLAPGQKVEVYTAIRVAAFGEVPKLLVRNKYDHEAPLIRYDLRGQIAKLVAPFASPSDAAGATAPRLISGKMGAPYPVTDNFDVRVDKISYSSERLDGQPPEDGQRYCVATVTITNRSPRAASFSSAHFQADLRDKDGEKVAYNGTILKATRDENADTELSPGEETRARFFWPVPATVEAKTVLLQYGYDKESRTYAIEVERMNE